MQKKRLCPIIMILNCLLILSEVYADPFMSYPGTRAKAMGGAFCAIADDASAAWYNPAGIAGDQTFDFTFEWSNAIVQKSDSKGNLFDLSQYGIDPESLSAEENKYFLSFKFSNKNNSSTERIGFSLYYISPYTIDWYFPPKSNVGEAFGTFEENLSIYGIAVAFSALNERLKCGATIEYVKIDFNPDNLRIVSNYQSTINYLDSVSLRSSSGHGFSSSVGIIGVLINNTKKAIKLKVGATYRAESSCSVSAGTSSEEENDDNISDEEEEYLYMKRDAIEKLIFNKPSSYDIGFALSKGFHSINSGILISGQYSRTDWSKNNKTIENKYKKTSFGAEWQIASSKRVFFSHFAFRGGWYQSESTLPKKGWPDVIGTTFGIGLLYNSYWGMDLAYEDRYIYYENIDKGKNFSLFSVAVTAAWD